MKLKYLFPFSIAEYLKVFAYYVIFFAVLFFSSFIISAHTSSLLLSAGRERAVLYFLSIITLFAFLAILNFFVFNLMIGLAYSEIAKIKFSWRIVLKFMLTFFILLLIFAIPLLFSIRLLEDKNPAAFPVTIVVFFAILHFSNLSYLFVALTGKTFEGIKKGFKFGTVKIKKLLIPYAFVIVVLFIFSLITKLLKDFEFISILVSGVLISWMALFVCRNIIKNQAKKK